MPGETENSLNQAFLPEDSNRDLHVERKRAESVLTAASERNKFKKPLLAYFSASHDREHRYDQVAQQRARTLNAQRVYIPLEGDEFSELKAVVINPNFALDNEFDSAHGFFERLANRTVTSNRTHSNHCILKSGLVFAFIVAVTGTMCLGLGYLAGGFAGAYTASEGSVLLATSSGSASSILNMILFWALGGAASMLSGVDSAVHAVQNREIPIYTLIWGSCLLFLCWQLANPAAAPLDAAMVTGLEFEANLAAESGHSSIANLLNGLTVLSPFVRSFQGYFLLKDTYSLIKSWTTDQMGLTWKDSQAQKKIKELLAKLDDDSDPESKKKRLKKQLVELYRKRAELGLGEGEGSSQLQKLILSDADSPFNQFLNQIHQEHCPGYPFYIKYPGYLATFLFLDMTTAGSIPALYTNTAFRHTFLDSIAYFGTRYLATNTVGSLVANGLLVPLYTAAIISGAKETAMALVNLLSLLAPYRPLYSNSVYNLPLSQNYLKRLRTTAGNLIIFGTVYLSVFTPLQEAGAASSELPQGEYAKIVNILTQGLIPMAIFANASTAPALRKLFDLSRIGVGRTVEVAKTVSQHAERIVSERVLGGLSNHVDETGGEVRELSSSISRSRKKHSDYGSAAANNSTVNPVYSATGEGAYQVEEIDNAQTTYV